MWAPNQGKAAEKYIVSMDKKLKFADSANLSFCGELKPLDQNFSSQNLRT